MVYGYIHVSVNFNKTFLSPFLPITQDSFYKCRYLRQSFPDPQGNNSHCFHLNLKVQLIFNNLSASHRGILFDIQKFTH